MKRASFGIPGLAALGLAILGPALALTPAPVRAETITLVPGVGAHAAGQTEAILEPFAEATGIAVEVLEDAGSLDAIAAQIEAGDITWDLLDMRLVDAVKGCDEGLLEQIDHSVLPPAPDGTQATEDFFVGTLTVCGVGSLISSMVIAYDSVQFSEQAPTALKDFFDPVRFPGKRGLQRTPRVNLEWALLADGVPPPEVYDRLSTPEGLDRAFAKLDTIKDQILWWRDEAEAIQLLIDGMVSMTSADNGDIFRSQGRERLPFAVIWDGQYWDVDLWVVPKGSGRLEGALSFIKFATGTERLAAEAARTAYGPARKSSSDFVGADAESGLDLKPHLPTSQESFSYSLNRGVQWWIGNGERVTQRFEDWLSR